MWVCEVLIWCFCWEMFLFGLLWNYLSFFVVVWVDVECGRVGVLYLCWEFVLVG